MGHKVHPVGFRLGVIKDWQSKWYADKTYTELLHEDLKVRRMLLKKLADASVPRVEIERSANQMTVTIHSAKPGIVIGKSGVKVEELRRELESLTGKKVRVTIQLTSRDGLAELTQMGFVLSFDNQALYVSGTLPIEKVEELAQKEWVRYISLKN